jgi:hypothetical protein
VGAAVSSAVGDGAAVQRGRGGATSTVGGKWAASRAGGGGLPGGGGVDATGGGGGNVIGTRSDTAVRKTMHAR